MSRTQKFCSLEQEFSCKLPKKEKHSLSMFLPHQMLNRLIMKFLPNIRNSRTCLKRKTLTPYRNIVHMITPLILEEKPNFHSGLSITYHKMNFVVIHEYIDENLAKGLIRHSKSLVNASILFVKKKDGYLLMCVDYYGLNWFIIKNQYPLPLISRLLDQISCAKVYIRIDLHGEYNLVCIWKYHNPSLELATKARACKVRAKYESWESHFMLPKM
jgi:hypothetical protein